MYLLGLLRKSCVRLCYSYMMRPLLGPQPDRSSFEMKIVVAVRSTNHVGLSNASVAYASVGRSRRELSLIHVTLLRSVDG